MTNIFGKMAVAVLLFAPVTVYAQTPTDVPSAVSPAPTAPSTIGESPDRPSNVPPPGITPEPGYDGLSAEAKKDAQRVRCVPGAACETDGTFRNVDK